MFLIQNNIKKSFILIAFALAACASPAPAPSAQEAAPAQQQTPPTPPTPSTEVRAPVAITLEAGATPTPGVPLQLTARVKRHAPLGAPLQITLTPPPGVTLDGTLAWAVPAGSAPGEELHTFTARFDKVPDQDLVLVADMQSADAGYHAEIAYRFGRPEPLPASPQRGGDDLNLKGRKLGKPVQMPPPTPSAP